MDFGAKLTALVLLACHALPAQSPETRAGAARIDITPDIPVALAGYSDPEGRISEGVHDRLYARAIAFQNGTKRLVLVSCDLSGFQYVPISIYRNEILSRYRLQPDELIMCGTHTHSAPMLFINRTYPHPNNFAYTEALKPKLLEVVGKALSSAGPARLGAGTGHSPIAVNRRVPIPAAEIKPGGPRVTMGRNPEGPVDRDVQVLRIARPDGTPVAALFDYACHSRSLRGGNRLVSGDIFGIAEQLTEKLLGSDIVTAAFAGASGDIDPWEVVSTFDDPATVRMGTTLGEEVVRVFRGIAASAPPGGIRTKQERLALPGKTAGSPKSIEMTAATVGEIAFVAVDCEALVEIGKAIKAASPFPNTLILTNCNGGTGYLPTARLYPERGYEVDLSGFAPEAANQVVEGAIRLLNSLRK